MSVFNTPEQKKIAASAFKSRRDELLHKISELQNEVNVIDLMLASLYKEEKESLRKFSVPELELKVLAELDKFNVNWSWRRKAEFVLTAKGDWMTTAEIADDLIKYYQPELTRLLAVRGLSVPLTTMAHIFSKRTNANGEYEFYVIKNQSLNNYAMGA